jgi:hypothetical protein
MLYCITQYVTVRAILVILCLYLLKISSNYCIFSLQLIIAAGNDLQYCSCSLILSCVFSHSICSLSLSRPVCHCLIKPLFPSFSLCLRASPCDMCQWYLIIGRSRFQRRSFGCPICLFITFHPCVRRENGGLIKQWLRQWYSFARCQVGWPINPQSR